MTRFVVDNMLGKLAKYLRILGYDTIYSDELNDEKIITECKNGRILLTCDRVLFQNSNKNNCKSYFFRPDQPVSCLLAILAKEKLIELEIDVLKSRCPICNGELKKDTPKTILFPTFNHETYICIKCGNIYWMGRHWRTITKTINEARSCLTKLLTQRN